MTLGAHFCNHSACRGRKYSTYLHGKLLSWHLRSLEVIHTNTDAHMAYTWIHQAMLFCSAETHLVCGHLLFHAWEEKHGSRERFELECQHLSPETQKQFLYYAVYVWQLSEHLHAHVVNTVISKHTAKSHKSLTKHQVEVTSILRNIKIMAYYLIIVGEDGNCHTIFTRNTWNGCSCPTCPTEGASACKDVCQWEGRKRSRWMQVS